jgi:ubiquinone/menaquinone biosynthesis C-methylase UbiE
MARRSHGQFVAAGAGSEPFEDGLKAPKGIAFGPDGNLYVASNGSPIGLFKFHGATGAFMAELLETLPGGVFFDSPIWGLTFGPDGLLYASGGGTGLSRSIRHRNVCEVAARQRRAGSSARVDVRDGNLYVAGGDTSVACGSTTARPGILGLFDVGGQWRPVAPGWNRVWARRQSVVNSGTLTCSATRYRRFVFGVFAALDFPLGLGPAGLVFTLCRQCPTGGNTPDCGWSAGLDGCAAGAGAVRVARGCERTGTIDAARILEYVVSLAALCGMMSGRPAEDAIPPAQIPGRRIATTMHYLGCAADAAVARRGRMQHALESAGSSQPTVCDMGCGNGFYSLRLAERVGDGGKVVAVDIQPEMLALLKEEAEAEGIKNIEPVLGTVVDPKLPAASIDLMLLVDVYHEFSHPEQMLRAIRRSLKPTGRVALVEFRGEDPDVPIKPLHKMTKEQILREIPPNRFKLVEQFDGLPWQHVMFFERDDAPEDINLNRR